MSLLIQNSFPVFNHVKFENNVNSFVPPLVEHFEAIDALFSLAKENYTVEFSRGYRVGDTGQEIFSFTIFTEEKDLGWCELATKITLWVLAILTVIPAIALLVTKAFYQQEIIKLIKGDTPILL